MELQYSPGDKESIIDYAKKLENQSLREACSDAIAHHNFSGKGNFGQILEKFYFGYEPNSNAEPDFKEVGMELKSSSLKILAKTGECRSKERLSLNIINYENVVNQDFETSDFLKKNASLLLVFYLHNPTQNILDYLIKLVGEWNFSLTDLEIIKNDWELIKKKIKEGKAHELSEGDTFYLGASTKGSTSIKSLRKQPFSKIAARQRAYSFKQGYVNHIIASISQDYETTYGKLITNKEVVTEQTLEEIVIEKFKIYYGKSIPEISEKTGVEIGSITSKSFYSTVTHAILNVELNKKIEEFEKANIEIKTVRVKANNQIEQSISFPAFKFEQIFKENWIDSEMKETIENKFLFIFFKYDGSKYILEKVKFWNMSLQDRKEVRKVWLKTKEVIQKGQIFNGYDLDKNGKIRLTTKGNSIRKNNLPKPADNHICHVRPHATKTTETYPLPVMDITLKTMEYTKQSFWLKNTYVRNEIYLK